MNRYTIAVIPALIFWVVSMVFFVLGLSFGTITLNMLTFGGFLAQSATGILFWVAVALSLANTAIQIVGNDTSKDDLGYVLFVGWMLSYILGIASNVNSLVQVLQIQKPILEWMVALSLGSMIEIMPERLFVLFWRNTFPRGIDLLGSLDRASRSFRRQASRQLHNNRPASPYAPTTSHKKRDNGDRRPRGGGQRMVPGSPFVHENPMTQNSHMIGANRVPREPSLENVFDEEN